MFIVSTPENENSLQEYVVTLKHFEDLEEFYEDMETPGGNLYIPNRSVSVTERRLISNNTNYLLTPQEAEQLQNDPRVESVSPLELELNSIKSFYTQESTNWDKSSVTSESYRNWGLLRVYEGAQRPSWGSDLFTTQSGEVIINAEGRNVDVVIVDGHIDPNHPEFAVNEDGTGGSRVVQFNWLSLNPIIKGTAAGTYVYTPYVGASDLTADNNHGCHVAGTVAGNRQGWARKANIYNISPYSTNSNGISSLDMWDYIRAWHRTKPINPETGRRNPTICNCSYGSSFGFPNSIGYETGPITYASYRGNSYGDTNYVNTMTKTLLVSAGIYAYGGTETDPIAEVPYYSTSVNSDIQGALADGIIIVAAAGNEYFKIDKIGGVDYGNYFIAKYNGVNYGWYYHRGCMPGAATGVICVGAIGSTSNETKASFSNCGPRIDIYAPGRYIMSSLHTGGVTDSRNSSYRVGKQSGTSMASPQVTGVLATAMEVYYNMTATFATSYIKALSKTDQITDTGGSTTDTTSLQGSPNLYLYYRQETPSSGNVSPKINYSFRPSKGVLFPRTRIRKTR